MTHELPFPSESVRGWTEDFEPIVRADIAARGVPPQEAAVLLERLHAVWQLYAPLLFPARDVRVSVPRIPLASVLSPAERAAIVDVVTAAVTASVRAAFGERAELIRALLIERLSLEAGQYIRELRNEPQPPDTHRSLRLERSDTRE